MVREKEREEKERERERERERARLAAVVDVDTKKKKKSLSLSLSAAAVRLSAPLSIQRRLESMSPPCSTRGLAAKELLELAAISPLLFDDDNQPSVTPI